MYTKELPRTNRQCPEKNLPFENTFASFADGKPFVEKKTGRLPVMGWNSWNAFGTGNTSALTRKMADCVVELGLNELGYKYLVLDDGCYLSERLDGRLSNETVKFPEGFKSLADYIHSKGLKFGMYNDIGTNLCAGSAVGTCGFEDVDAESYVDWDIDFLKVDNCYYLWDNATFSNSENARYSYAPNIKSIKLTNSKTNESFNFDAVKDGELVGLRAEKTENFVTKIGTFDGTNTGTTPVGPRSGELVFKFSLPSEGEYTLKVVYASGKEEGCGQWLQVFVSQKDFSCLCYDDLLPETSDNQTFVESPEIPVSLKKGENKITLMNHRRQENVLSAYGAMFYGLKKAKPDNDIILSICEWGKTHPQNWGFKVGDSWRILNDITFRVGSDGDPGYGAWSDPGTPSVTSQYNKCVIMDEFSGLEKGWNDPDMLMIGMKGLNLTMNKTHFTMWCMMSSPLMLGIDLRRVQKGDALYNIIANKDLIDLNQDKLGIQAKRILTSGISHEPDKDYIQDNERFDILAKPLSDGSVVVSVINLSEKNDSAKGELKIQLIKEKLDSKISENFKKACSYKVKNLWDKSEFVISDKIDFPQLEPCDNFTVKVIPM